MNTMKNVFVFNDSRVTDREYHVLALSEDGQGIALIRFNDWTMPHCRFAMCVSSETDASGDSFIAADNIRAEVEAAYNISFGRGNWHAVWVEHPKQDPMCIDALRVMHADMAAKIEKRNAALVESLFGSLGIAQEVRSPATH
ncbi:hypothetical protein [Paraburkholderia sp. SIMBA_030]|uniref:hypothetical protein n=1 Tax=Paraburkholderia sp. SIMBA_030 TaxID=3085773 RepID=UPI00397C78DA